MGALYDNPEGTGWIAVHDPDPRADRPPTTDESEVVAVDFEHYNLIAGEHQ